MAISKTSTTAGPTAHTASISPDRLPLQIAAGWGIGSLSMSLMFNATSVLSLRYLVDYVGLAAAAAGLMIGGAKAYDAIVDPWIGTVSDRTRSRWGRRRSFLLAGALLSALSFAALFNLAVVAAPAAELGVPAWLLALAVLLLNATGYALFCVPYLAMPAEMTDHYHERTRLMSFRVASVALGQLAASYVGPLLIAFWGGGVIGHGRASLVLAVVIVAGGWLSFALTRGAPNQGDSRAGFARTGAAHEPVAAEHAGLGFLSGLRAAATNRPFIALLALKLSYLLGLAVLLSVLPFLFTYVLGLGYAELGTFFLGQSLVMLATQPLWVALSKRCGKKLAYCIAAALYCGVLLSWLAAGPGTTSLAIALRGVASGLGAGGLLLMSQSLLPDTMEYDYRRSGQRREGIFAGVYTTIEKLSFALGPAITGPLLGAAGYIASSGSGVVQPASAIRAMYVCAAIIPTVATLLSCVALLFYDLDERRLRELAFQPPTSLDAP